MTSRPHAITPGIQFQLATARPDLEPPEGRRIIGHVVLNVEYWPFDEAMPRSILPGPHGIKTVPDIPNFSWVEYGLRCGLPRILQLLDECGVRASISLNAGIINAYPQIAEAVMAPHLEIVGHGVRQRPLTAEDDEFEVIQESIALIRDFTGAAPRGWLGPGLQETAETAAFLKRAGIEYLCDWCLDDLPTWVDTPHGRLLAVPYTLELNDSVLHAVQQHPSDELYRRLEATLATFDQDGSKGPKIVTLALHPHLIGVPHRFLHLVRCLGLLQDRADVIFLTGSEITDWYVAAEQSAQRL